jgi:hypothetical protein
MRVFVTGDHGLEIIPAGPDYLGYVNQERQHVSDREREMLPSGNRSTRLLSQAWPADSVRISFQ